VTRLLLLRAKKGTAAGKTDPTKLVSTPFKNAATGMNQAQVQQLVLDQILKEIQDLSPEQKMLYLSNIKGMLLTGTWHTIGEKELKGTIDEEFGSIRIRPIRSVSPRPM